MNELTKDEQLVSQLRYLFLDGGITESALRSLLDRHRITLEEYTIITKK